ncbi:MAG: lysostaphin resistance A-like protein [Halobacteriaceae archaeon]
MSSRSPAVAGGRLHALGLSLVVALAGFAFGFLAMLVLGSVLAAAGVDVTGPGGLFVSLISLQGVGFPLAAVAYLRVRELPWSFVPASVPSLRDVGLIVLGWIGALIAAYGAALAVTSVVPSPAENQAAEIALDHPEVIPYLIPLVLLLNGPGEELLFRGVVQGTLRERFGPVAAIVLASLLFSPAHLTALLGASAAAVGATMAILLVPSFVFGALYEYSENIVVPSVVHGIYNATLFLTLYAAATMPESGSSTALALL